MSDYAEIQRLIADALLKEGKGPWSGNMTSPITPANTLTAEKLLAMVDQVNAQMRANPEIKIDLYGHDLLDQEQAFMLDRRKLNEQMYAGRSAWMRRLVEHADLDREMVIVPRARLHQTFQTLREQGLDVRLEPRYGTGERAKPSAPTSTVKHD